MTVRTRFAPSPTGVLHLGSVRTALYCWLYAKRHGGKFVLRIEDTDRERSTSENVDAILEGLAWLGLDFDEGPIFQTQRFDRYREVVDDWLSAGHAYHCYCTKEELASLREEQMARGEKARYDGRCRDLSSPREGISPVVRFRNPQSGSVVVNDRVKGQVVFQNDELDDLIIARSDGSPTYNFTVVVDDSDMQISHVIRGDDHLNNTPRQINMFSALGVEPPEFAHLPMILGADGSKLSKRHGAVDIRDYRKLGYLPEAMLNYLVRLGWSHGDQEVFSAQEMIELFDIDDINVSAAAFNPEKLRWLNQKYIISSDAAHLAAQLQPFMADAGIDVSQGPDLATFADGFRERAETLQEMAEKSRFYYSDFDEIDANAAKKHLRPVILDALVRVRERLSEIAAWDNASISSAIEDTAAEFDLGLGKVGQPVRVAVTGNAVSPPIDITLVLVGRERTLARLDNAIAFVNQRAAQSQ